MQGKPTLPRYRRLLAIVVKDLQGYLTVRTERLGRVAVLLTLPLGGERTRWNAQGRVAV